MNSQKALLELLFKTQAVHTKTFVRDYFEIQERPEDPFVIHQLLLEYQIKSMVVKFGVEQLREVSFPIITLMANGNIRDFALVHGLEADRLSYSHKAQSVCHETLQEFGSKWTGIAILVDPRNQKPEPGYKRTKADFFLFFILFFFTFTKFFVSNFSHSLGLLQFFL